MLSGKDPRGVGKTSSNVLLVSEAATIIVEFSIMIKSSFDTYDVTSSSREWLDLLTQTFLPVFLVGIATPLKYRLCAVSLDSVFQWSFRRVIP